MKKWIVFVISIVFAISLLGLYGCSADSNTITLYEFKEEYKTGTVITKDMLRPIKVTLPNGFVSSNGTVYTQEELSKLAIVTSDNYNTLITKTSALMENVQMGQLFTTNHIGDKSYFVNCLVLAKDITRGTQITKEHIEIKASLKRNENDVDEHPEDYIGKYVVVNMISGERLTPEIIDNLTEPLEEIPVADPKWVLSSEIPANYVPVPDAVDVYMVIGEDGNIRRYRERRVQADGSLCWMDMGSYMANKYAPILGMENVYKTTNNDGAVSYYRYIRNEDNSFAFIPIDENGNVIGELSDNGEILTYNYVRLRNNIYGIYNEHGVLIDCKEKLDENGNIAWNDMELPDMFKYPHFYLLPSMGGY